MVDFVMPTCEELVEQLHALRRDTLMILANEKGSNCASAVADRFDRLIARYEE